MFGRVHFFFFCVAMLFIHNVDSSTVKSLIWLAWIGFALIYSMIYIMYNSRGD